jgi:hypothetical protein
MHLTEHDERLTVGGRDRPAEIEVTPAMIKAGAYALCDYDPETETVSEGATRVFAAMAMARSRASVSANRTKCSSSDRATNS